MRDMGTVYGSREAAVPLVIGYDTVYVHTDIQEYQETMEGGEVMTDYKYHEIQYTKDEYLKIQADKQSKLEENITNVQGAILELYESMEG